MSSLITPAQSLRHSQNVLDQWEPRWEMNAKENGETLKRLPKRKHKDLVLAGRGKRCVCVGMGASLEDAMELIKEYKGDVEIGCVDKAYHHLVRNGIIPDYVCVCDALIDFEKWGAPYVHESKNTKLFMNVIASPRWAKKWQGPVWFYVSKDNLGTADKYARLSGCNETIPASSNVGNTLVVILAQILGHDRYILTGYDYCWAPDGNYYAYDWSPDKRCYMRHDEMLKPDGHWCFSSHNLKFSAKWMTGFVIKMHEAGIQIVDASNGILEGPRGKLTTQLKLARLNKNRKWTQPEAEEFINAHRNHVTLADGEYDKIPAMLQDENMATLNVIVRAVPRSVLEHAEANLKGEPANAIR